MANQRPDGIAFVIQKSPAGTGATGTPGSGIGYGSALGNPSGITHSVAVEFDSWYNSELNDPPVFHIGVHSDGANPNNASEDYRIGGRYENPNYNISELHVTIQYDPVDAGGTITIQFNDQPAFLVNGLDIESLANLDAYDGNAYVGFTAGSHNGTGGAYVETIKVTDWKFSFSGEISAANTLVALQENVTAGAGLSISVTAVDQYNNSMIIDGVGRSDYVLTATLTEADGNTLTSPASYSGSGKYVLVFNITKSGTATVHVFLNSTLVGQGQYSTEVIPAAPYAPFSYPFGFTGLNAVAGVLETFYVQPQDIFGNNITTDVGPVVQTSITSQTDNTYTLTFMGVYDAAVQCYSVTYNVTLMGNFTLKVTVDGQETNDSIRTLQVSPAEVYPETSVLYGVSVTATAGEKQMAFLQLKDVFGNNASSDVGSEIVIHATQGATSVNGTVEGCVAGLCPISYNLTVASYGSQTYTMIVLVNGRSVQGSSLTNVKVSPAALAPSVSYAYGTGITSGVAGELGYIYIQLTDTFGNNNTYADSTFTIKMVAGNLDIAPTQISGPAGGLYVFQYNLTLATTYTLSIAVNTLDISNAQNNVAISPNVVYPPTCEGFGHGLAGQLIAGDNNVFFIQLRDVFYNNISMNGTENLQVLIENDLLKLNATTQFNAGLYEVLYNITLAAEYTMTITINDIPILNSVENITIEPAGIYPLQSIATNVEPGVIAGANNQFQVQLRDVYANDIKNVVTPAGLVTATFVPLLNGSDVNIDTVYSGSGVYTLTYNATQAAQYTLSIFVNATAILGGGQYPVHVVPAAADPARCVATGHDLADSVAGLNSTFYIYLFDVFNNSITQPSQNDTPVITISEQDFELEFDPNLPAFVVSFNITTSGNYTVAIAIAGVEIVSTPLAITPAPLFAKNCLATGPSLAGATAGDVGTFAIYLRDQFGNNIPDYTQVTSISVITSLENSHIGLNPVQNGAGSYVLNYNLTVAGTYQTQITINSLSILGSPFDTKIGAAPFNPHGTVTDGLKTTIVAGQLNSFTILMKDIWGNNVTDSSLPNPITPGEISVRFNNTPIEITVTAPVDGVFLVQYNYTRSGTFFMSVTINDTEVGAAPPGDLVIQPNVVYPPACVAQGDATSEAIVKQSNTFTVVVRDVFGNDRMWAPKPPIVQLSASGSAISYGNAENQTDGTYLIRYFIDEKKTYTMSVTFSGIHINGSPFKVNANYGNGSPPTVLIVCLVLGSVVIVGALVGGFIWYRRRRTPYVALLD
eukprot:Phypoly_transcript_00698.p1 GENE.Phypoly_transcript_00698~~Phypoly_transcript_00698.p1  ORF type:complete len:1364 (-),score=231.60 Phypoly_transcript_00698:121-3909(-)